MKKIYLIITIALLIGNPSIAKKKKPPIKGGTVVTNNSLIPHQVLITGPDDGGGAIIAKGWVLTAAHLNMGSTTNLYASVINRNNLNQGQQRQQIRFEKHPSYAGGNSPLNDIALLQLNQDFNLNANVGMIKLASPSNSSLWNTNQTVRVSGFGRTDTGSGLSDELRYVDVPVTSVDNTDKLIYAGGNNYDSCQGDSGGPMFANNTLTGIVSYGATCGGGGAYTMVSQFLSFIIEKIHKYGTPNEVCGNTTFENIGIMPDDVSFAWTASPSNLFTNSSGTGLTFTTAQNGTNNGVGTIPLTATHTSGQIVSVSKQVWVGQPAAINIVTDGTFNIYSNNATICKSVGYCMTSNSTVTLNGSDFNTATGFSYNGWPSYNSFFNTYTQQVTNDHACFGTNNTGTYYLSIYASNTCGSNSRSVIFQVSNCGYRIYPNPAKTTISIEFDEPDKLESIPDLIEIKSEKTLQTVRKKELQGNEKRNPKAVEKISFDVADLPRGVYYVHLTFGSIKEQKVDKVRIILNE